MTTTEHVTTVVPTKGWPLLPDQEKARWECSCGTRGDYDWLHPPVAEEQAAAHVREASEQPTMDEPAPYPKGAVTADPLARFLAVSAWRTWCVEFPRLLRDWEAAGRPETGPLRDAWVYASSAASAQFTAVYLLREAGSRPLDAVAEDAAMPYDGDVDWAIDHLEAWMDEWGIDRERLMAEASGERPS